jgi:hypothetical protein
MRLGTRFKHAYAALLGRSYEAGGGGPRWQAISSMAQHAQQALAQRALISQRAAWLTANAPLAESIVLNWQTNLIAHWRSAGRAIRMLRPPGARGYVE